MNSISMIIMSFIVYGLISGAKACFSIPVGFSAMITASLLVISAACVSIWFFIGAV